MAVSKWDKVLKSKVLSKAGKGCSTVQELASALEPTAGWPITSNSLDNAFKRNRSRLDLKSSLMDYMGKAPPNPHNKRADVPRPPRLEDISFSLSAEKKRRLKKAKRFVVTASLNNTALDEKVWKSIRLYANENKAEVIVLPVRYKNPTNRVDGKILDEGAWWPKEIVPYLTDELLELHEHLWIMGHVKIQATASKPLTGLETLSKGASAIFGHGQLAMKMVPTPQNKLPKMLHTTGSVSQPKYSTTKAGVCGAFFHEMGGLMVELDGPRFHVRALVADSDGGFYDLDKYYSPSKVLKSDGALALVTGDEHALFNDDKCRKATYLGKKSIVGVLKPKEIIRHDVFDGYSVNHHSDKDPVTQMAKAEAGYHIVKDELQLTIDHIDETTPKGVKNIIVSSNHHDHLLQWMKNKVPLDSPCNARTWHELWGLLLPTIKMGKGGVECGDPFALWAASKAKSDTVFLSSDEHYSIAGIDVSHHGHRGANGARGSINQFAKVGIKTIIAHSHTPGWQHGCVQVGTSSRLKLEYTGGLSSWAHSHCAIYPNGKRQLIIVVDGVWRLEA